MPSRAMSPATTGILDLIPLIHHLPPPSGASQLSIDRLFSPIPLRRCESAHGRQLTSCYSSVWGRPSGPLLLSPRWPDHLRGELRARLAAKSLERRCNNTEVNLWRNSWVRPDAAPPALSISLFATTASSSLDHAWSEVGRGIFRIPAHTRSREYQTPGGRVEFRKR